MNVCIKTLEIKKFICVDRQRKDSEINLAYTIKVI